MEHCPLQRAAMIKRKLTHIFYFHRRMLWKGDRMLETTAWLWNADDSNAQRPYSTWKWIVRSTSFWRHSPILS